MYYVPLKEGFSEMFKKLILSLCLLSPLSAYAGEGFFLDTPEDAFILAMETKQDILLIFGAPYCKYCTIMKNDVIKNIQVFDNMLICYVNVEDREDLQKEYKVSTLPDYMIYRNKVEVKRKVGYTGFDQFKAWLGR